MGSVAHVDDDIKELARDVHTLARLGVRLVDSDKGGVMVRNSSESSFVSDVKAKQCLDPFLVDLKEVFQECCEDENLVKKSLCLDVPTRWNSTYMMLSRVIEYESAIVEYADRDIGLALHLKFVDIVDETPTDHVLAKMEENMKEKFDKYWGDTEKMNKIFFIPCVLDAHHKFNTLGFALKKMFGKKGVAIEIGVQKYMESLFNEYAKPNSNDKSGQLSSTEVDTSYVSIGEFGNIFEELNKHKSENGGASSKSELVKYLEEDTETGKLDFDVLLWWKVNSPRFPSLSEMARDVCYSYFKCGV
ncbi:zinc finger BED domain-containing protein RICESLEEPER 1-like [Solanum stenotomum]|uniref:zinc finger BED domain-containing protein RICESLEEPER 1-like n=1 Tax=Solanum stenotomum TaxID=172797 RepID=UPI0020D19849|nr:zinc finger BED domain-containing protein RICESLEEPER 1-like [Solanum stenotomum]